MALPAHQLVDLRGRIKLHVQRKKELEIQISHLEREVRVHEEIVRLLREKRLVSILEELNENHDVAQSHAGRELELTERRGLELPKKSSLAIIRGPNDSLRVRLDVDKGGEMPYSLQWDSATGFGPAPKAD